MPSDRPSPGTLIRGAALALACVGVYWLWLGASGFSASEGHRVAPAWEILRTGDWLVTRMFEQVYVRKPPGIAWAIALATSLLGHTEFAARAVSALAATFAPFVAWFYASRWFDDRGGAGPAHAEKPAGSPPTPSSISGGRRWTSPGFAAGAAHALTPLFWSPGRSAEIEALHALGVQLACLALVDLLSASPPRGRVVLDALAAFLGVTLAGLCKGPAAAPALLGVVVGACLASRSFRPLVRPSAYLPVFVGIAALVVLGMLIARRLGTLHEPVVAQSPGEFLWAADKLPQIFALAPVAFVSALPVSLALLFPWGPDAAREGERSPSRYRTARTLAWAWLAALAIYTALGVSNPRYAAPAAVLLPPLVSYVLAGVAGGFVPLRARIAKALMLGRPLAAAVALLVGGVVYARLTTQSRARDSGRTFGREIASVVHGPCEIFANHAVEARPEILLEARRAAADIGVTLRPRWVTPTLDDLPAASGPESRYVLLRLDAGSDEARFTSLWDDRLVRRASASVGPYDLGLFEVIDPQFRGVDSEPARGNSLEPANPAR